MQSEPWSTWCSRPFSEKQWREHEVNVFFCLRGCLDAEVCILTTEDHRSEGRILVEPLLPLDDCNTVTCTCTSLCS